MGVEDGAVLQADDYLQNYKLELMVRQYEAPKNEPEFLLTAEGSTGEINVGPQPESAPEKNGKNHFSMDTRNCFYLNTQCQYVSETFSQTIR